METDNMPPAGWYDDPNVPGLRRYWDGVQWSNHTQAKESKSQLPSHNKKYSRRMKLWILLLIAPIPLLILNLVIQVFVRFFLSENGIVTAFLNIVSVLVGAFSVIALILFPLWIVLLVLESKKS